MKTVKLEDVKRGLTKLGLEFEIQSTKVPEWKRLHVHELVSPKKGDKVKVTRYICKISIHNGLVNSYKFFGMPDYYTYAINLMMLEGVILNHINYYALKVQAFNATQHLLDRVAEIEKDKNLTHKSKRFLQHKARLHYHYQKQKLFTALFTARYYNGVQPSSEKIGYAC